jgi:hypothetical protein
MVEVSFVFVDEVKEHPDGSVQVVPHYAVQSSQVEKPAWRTMEYLKT